MIMKKQTALAAALLALGAGNAWSQSQTAGGQLEKCNETLGTLTVVEDRNAGWYRQMQQYEVQSTVPLLRMLIQQSNCFVVVERGAAMNVMKQERELERSGEARQGGDFGKGQLVSADYAMNPSITFSSRDSGGRRRRGRRPDEQARLLGLDGRRARRQHEVQGSLDHAHADR